MKIILTVVGKGTRLRPLTHTKAKSLVNVAGKTVLEHIVSRCLRYTNNVIAQYGVLDEGVNFIQKPFAVVDLAKMVDAILNRTVNQ